MFFMFRLSRFVTKIPGAVPLEKMSAEKIAHSPKKEILEEVARNRSTNLCWRIILNRFVVVF